MRSKNISEEIDKSASAAKGAVLGYLDEQEVSSALGIAIPTLRSWASRRQGPPRTVVGRRPIYRQIALEAWLLARERDFDKLRGPA